MSAGRFQFADFALDPVDRTLHRDGARVEVSARYLDALVLLVSEAGRLVTKDRFLEEVWRGVPVTDEALTQSIKTLRRQLGDDAGRPRFIETVPKHGYRFVAPVTWQAESAPAAPATPPAPATPAERDGAASRPRSSPRAFFVTGGAGTLGAAVAGVAGGLFYGSVGASGPVGAGAGGLSVLLVLLWLTIVAALVGGAGVSFGIAAAGFARAPAWRILGGAAGGLVVGGTVKLLGLDAFNLLLGRSPGDITGALEGVLLGGAVGAGSWLSMRRPSGAPLMGHVLIAAAAGSIGGVVVLLLGGTLMGGSLDLLAHAFPTSRLRIDRLGEVFGESGFGPVARLATAGLEGALFGGCIVGSMRLATRNVGP